MTRGGGMILWLLRDRKKIPQKRYRRFKQYWDGDSVEGKEWRLWSFEKKFNKM